MRPSSMLKGLPHDVVLSERVLALLGRGVPGTPWRRWRSRSGPRFESGASALPQEQKLPEEVGSLLIHLAELEKRVRACTLDYGAGLALLS
jgi:hypothetical protein